MAEIRTGRSKVYKWSVGCLGTFFFAVLSLFLLGKLLFPATLEQEISGLSGGGKVHAYVKGGGVGFFSGTGRLNVIFTSSNDQETRIFGAEGEFVVIKKLAPDTVEIRYILDYFGNTLTKVEKLQGITFIYSEDVDEEEEYREYRRIDSINNL